MLRPKYYNNEFTFFENDIFSAYLHNNIILIIQ